MGTCQAGTFPLPRQGETANRETGFLAEKLKMRQFGTCFPRRMDLEALSARTPRPRSTSRKRLRRARAPGWLLHARPGRPAEHASRWPAALCPGRRILWLPESSLSWAQALLWIPLWTPRLRKGWMVDLLTQQRKVSPGTSGQGEAVQGSCSRPVPCMLDSPLPSHTLSCVPVCPNVPFNKDVLDKGHRMSSF